MKTNEIRLANNTNRVLRVNIPEHSFLLALKPGEDKVVVASAVSEEVRNLITAIGFDLDEYDEQTEARLLAKARAAEEAAKALEAQIAAAAEEAAAETAAEEAKALEAPEKRIKSTATKSVAEKPKGTRRTTTRK